MKTKVALLIIYNHRYDKNIPIINNLYKDKFSHIYHIIPFYDGTEENVIPVYESSYYFQGYISQAYTHIKNKGYTHYFVVADDMIINPTLNENNLWNVMQLEHDDCYIDDLVIFQKLDSYWPRLSEALDYNPFVSGVEVKNILPTVNDAQNIFINNNLPFYSVPYKTIFKITNKRELLRRLLKTNNLKYPLVGGYSDILLITNNYMDKFCQYCGAFSATKLFVEIAIPTALVLSAKNIKFNKDITLKNGALWSEEDKLFLKRYNNNLKLLVEEFPQDLLYIHPIKLSQWK